MANVNINLLVFTYNLKIHMEATAPDSHITDFLSIIFKVFLKIFKNVIQETFFLFI